MNIHHVSTVLRAFLFTRPIVLCASVFLDTSETSATKKVNRGDLELSTFLWYFIIIWFSYKNPTKSELVTYSYLDWVFFRTFLWAHSPDFPSIMYRLLQLRRHLQSVLVLPGKNFRVFNSQK